MGMYTDLHCTAIINPKYRDKIQNRVYQNIKWKKLFHKLGHEFCINRRCNDIPRMENQLNDSDIFDGTTLRIRCSTKDYTYLYDEFFDFLKLISDEITEYTTFYEENREYDCKTNMWIYSWKNYITGKWDEYKISDAEIKKATFPFK